MIVAFNRPVSKVFYPPQFGIDSNLEVEHILETIVNISLIFCDLNEILTPIITVRVL